MGLLGTKVGDKFNASFPPFLSPSFLFFLSPVEPLDFQPQLFPSEYG